MRFFVANFDLTANVDGMREDPSAIELDWMAAPQVCGIRVKDVDVRYSEGNEGLTSLDPAWVESLKAIVAEEVAQVYNESDDTDDEAGKDAIKERIDWHTEGWKEPTRNESHPSTMLGVAPRQEWLCLLDGECVAMLVLQERDYA